MPLFTWLGSRAPELALMTWGIFSRFYALRSYSYTFGYDSWEHEATIDWWRTHFEMPPLLLSRCAYHPQLYYLICGVLKRWGGSMQLIQGLSAALGALRLLLMWWAAERFMKPHRGARILLLALAVSLPVSLEMDVMVTQEPLSNLLSL